MKNHPLGQKLIPFVLLAFVLAGCGSEQGAPEQESAGQGSGGNAGQSSGPGETPAPEDTAAESTARESTVVTGYTPPESPLPPPEPEEAPPLEEEPAGEVVGLDAAPEGVVADPETGLVAIGLRDPDGLALVDGESGELVRTTELSGAPRHLGLAASGGPVLAPAEQSDTLFQIGLPDGEIVAETPVDNFPHDAAGAPGGRDFVISEAESTALVIEGGEVVERFETPMNPGGVTVTEGGLVGIVGVRGLALEVFEADTLDSLGRIDAGEGPTHVESGPGDRLYVADTRGDAVLAYRSRPEPGRTARISLPGGSPYGLAVDPEREHLWVTLTAENRLIQYDISGDVPRELAAFPTVRQPNSVTVDPADGTVFVGGRANEDLQIIDPGSAGP